MDKEFRAVKGGHYTPYRKLLQVRKLERCIKYLKCWDKLCKAIAYSMVTPVLHRCVEQWSIVHKSLSIDLTNIAVYITVEEPHTFSDIVVVDYTVLRSKEKEQFLSKYPQLRELLLLELRLTTHG